MNKKLNQNTNQKINEDINIFDSITYLSEKKNKIFLSAFIGFFASLLIVLFLQIDKDILYRYELFSKLGFNNKQLDIFDENFKSRKNINNTLSFKSSKSINEVLDILEISPIKFNTIDGNNLIISSLYPNFNLANYQQSVEGLNIYKQNSYQMELIVQKTIREILGDLKITNEKFYLNDVRELKFYSNDLNTIKKNIQNIKMSLNKSLEKVLKLQKEFDVSKLTKNEKNQILVMSDIISWFELETMNTKKHINDVFNLSKISKIKERGFDKDILRSEHKPFIQNLRQLLMNFKHINDYNLVYRSELEIKNWYIYQAFQLDQLEINLESYIEHFNKVIKPVVKELDLNSLLLFIKNSKVDVTFFTKFDKFILKKNNTDWNYFISEDKKHSIRTLLIKESDFFNSKGIFIIIVFTIFGLFLGIFLTLFLRSFNLYKIKISNEKL